MKISVAYSKTVNLGNFKSMRAEAGMEFDTPECSSGDDVGRLFRDAWSDVKAQVEEQIKKEKK